MKKTKAKKKTPSTPAKAPIRKKPPNRKEPTARLVDRKLCPCKDPYRQLPENRAKNIRHNKYQDRMRTKNKRQQKYCRQGNTGPDSEKTGTRANVMRNSSKIQPNV